MVGVLAILWFETVCIVLLWLFFIWSCPGDLTIIFPLLPAGCQEIVIEGMLAAVRMTIRGVKARKWEDSQDALLPVLLVSHTLSQSQWKRKENLQLFALHPTSCSKHIKGRQSREKCEQLLSAVGLSQVHPSVQPSDNLGELPQDCGVRQQPCGVSRTCARAKPTQQQHSKGRQRGTTEVHGSGAALCIAERGVAYQLQTMMFDGSLAERQKSRHLPLPDTS